MKIDIVIKDVSVEIAQQIFALIGGDAKVEQVTEAKAETIKTDAHLPFTCEWCGRKFKSQNSVNSHKKYCEDRPKEKVVKKEKKETVKEAPKKAPVQKKRKVKVPTQKKKDPPKPTFVTPADQVIADAVVTSVLANGNNISASASISHNIVVGLRKKYGDSDQLKKFAQTLEGSVALVLKKIEKALGAGVCMGMPLPDGYQIAVFDNKGITKSKLMKSL